MPRTPSAGTARRRTSRTRGSRRRRPQTALTLPVSDATLENLAKIEHIVVLMLENRSFDHMLGYLRLEAKRDDIDGLTREMANTHADTSYKVHHLTTTKFTEDQDPCHSEECTRDQLAGGNGGFASNYAQVYPSDPGLVLGYYDASDLPIYAHLAREFCVCDRWFSSVPGPTMPNRVYAAAGRPGKQVKRKPPLYDAPAFTRHLSGKRIEWRWYYHDVPTIAAIDGTYRDARRAYKVIRHFSRRADLGRSFLDRAAAGELPSVSWIDPNFADVGFNLSGSNDDHPPSDVRAGQELVLKVYNALAANEATWNKVLFVITYDEHGGFFDHVRPPEVQDDNPGRRRYGVRVPALVVSPWVERGSVSSMTFDHTSIIKTILLRFCRSASGRIPDMGLRVATAGHLGGLLTRRRPRKAPPAPRAAVRMIARWQSDAFVAAYETQARGEPPKPRKPTDFQQDMLALKVELRQRGVPVS